MTGYQCKVISVSILLLMLCGCEERLDLAPVVELNWREVNSKLTSYRVQRGDTLYAIAFRYDQDYQRLANANHLSSPYKLRVGQTINLRASSLPSTPMPSYPVRAIPVSVKPIATVKPVSSTTNTMVVHQKPVSMTPQLIETSSIAAWLWPLHGRVVTNYAPQQGQKGIDIAGSKGEKIYAASGGIVAYAGNGLAGYGNLIIIKHNNQYLTAYGNNSKNFVKEGQRVHAGQAIAEIGVVNRQFWGVHFEIRKTGKPVNPLNYLQKA